ncbi:DUF4232 domain-containing protein [Streptomyces polygonati]|uniref:DUF4232 domain-containing protein n=1 Tax=Streptomyces polygonati TaxID=1617087 RepID=A0ABV8HLC2_9ACTN
MTWGRGRALLALGVVVLAGGCGPGGGAAVSVTAAPRPATPKPPACPTDGLRVSLGPVDGAMGLRAVQLRVVNCSTASRTVSGYPAVRVLDEHRAPYHVTVHHGPSVAGAGAVVDPGPTRIALAPGRLATAALVWRNLVTRSDVVALTGAAVEITPTQGALPHSLPLNVDLGNTGRLDVMAWQAAPPTATDRPASPPT